MQTIAKVVSAVALLGTITPSLLFFSGTLELATMKGWMLAATILWFIATPLWMNRKVKD